MKTSILSVAVAILAAAVPTSSHGFADWVTSKFQQDTNNYTSAHHSDASGNGIVYTAFVTRTGDVDNLYFTSKNLYLKPGETEQRPTVAIDSGDRISSVQIQHDPVSGDIHLAYSMSSLVDDGMNLVLTETLWHVRYQPYVLIKPIKSSSVAVRNFLTGPPFEISLKLYSKDDGLTFIPAMAYYSRGVLSAGASLSYAEQLPNNSWDVTQIDSGPLIGQGCQLALGSGGQAAIIYEDGTNPVGVFHLARRQSDESWNTEIAVLGGFGATVSDPSVTLSGPLAKITYVSLKDGDYNLVLREELRNASVSFQTVRTASVPIRDPQIIVSNGRFVISYSQRHSNLASLFEPWAASRRSNSTIFTSYSLPQPAGDLGTGPTTISLDDQRYPVITWTRSGTSSARACFCPDFTDFDCDGVPHLQEVAFRMNPNEPDVHKLPKAEIETLLLGEDPSDHLTLTFPTAYSNNPTFDMNFAALETQQFRYQASMSRDLEDWTSGLESIEMRLDIPDEPSPIPFGKVISLYSVDSTKGQKRFLRLHISRL